MCFNSLRKYSAFRPFGFKHYINLHPYTVWRGLSTMWRQEGMRGMFKGNGANCIRIVPNSAVKFLTYDYLSGAVLSAARKADPETEMNAYLRLVAGTALALAPVHPTNVVSINSRDNTLRDHQRCE